MPSDRPNATRTLRSSAAGPARFFAGILLAGSARSAHALVPNTLFTATTFRGSLPFSGAPPQQRRTCVRPRGARGMRLSATGGSGAGDIDSSELYADMRRRLEELRHSSSNDCLPDSDNDDKEEEWRNPTDRRRSHPDGPPGGSAGKDAPGVKAYSGQEMKKAYYEAFWRARNLHNEAKFEQQSGDVDGSDAGSSSSSPDAAPPAVPPTAQLGSRSTLLTPMALGLVQSHLAFGAEEASEAAVPASSDIQGLTQMYYLEEEAEAVSAAPRVAVLGAGEDVKASRGVFSRKVELPEAEGMRVMAAAGGSLSAEPQGFTQMFYLDAEEEAEVAATLPLVEGRSFLRQRLGVPGDVVQDLRQVELDHARLAMLAVLLSGVLGAGAGVPSSPGLIDAHAGFAALAEVARTPWLDPCVAGVILAAKALSEGDWRLGKGALAGWADQALRTVSDSGAKLLRLGSGEEMRRLAIEMEVKHGRVALGAVVCAMAQQGLMTVAV